MKKSGLCAVLASGLALCSGAFAQDAVKGFYAGLSLGQSKFRSCSSSAGATLSNCSDTDTAWKIFAGHQFSPNFAWEVGYNDFGRVSSDAVATIGGSTFAGNAKVEATAWELSGIGSLPLASQFSIYGKLGAYYAKTESGTNLSSVSTSATNHNSNFTFGLGARYDVTRNIALRAEWQRFPKVGADTTGKGDIDVLAIGGLYRFQ
ncbi:MAG TPA: outer membrane beta-barrel protein [Burkholderiales bacterium]|nr:outer membrane beta-barrel protein [Burkholderiales bacterium]